jgi:membrane carboxypeptidase/penicillin-binding protein
MRRAAARRLVWETLVALHLSEAEKLTVILSRSFTGEGRWGASASCRALFGHELSKLTRDEAAAFVALTEHPGFIGRPTEFARRKQELISSYRPR